MQHIQKLQIDWCGAADQPCIVPVQRRGCGGAKRWRVGWNKRGELLELWECGFAIGQKRRDAGELTEKLKLRYPR